MIGRVEHDQLIREIARRAADETPHLPAPVSAEAVERAEADLGFRLPALLAAVYRQVGDGGFGPEYRLFRLAGEEGVVGRYQELRRDLAGSEWAWPGGVLPILDWGCGMYAAVDCRSADATVLLFDPNPGDPDLAWYVDAPSLTGWFGHYVAGTGWWSSAEMGEDIELRPWPYAAARS
jgi:hypothetical protein